MPRPVGRIRPGRELGEPWLSTYDREDGRPSQRRRSAGRPAPGRSRGSEPRGGRARWAGTSPPDRCRRTRRHLRRGRGTCPGTRSSDARHRVRSRRHTERTIRLVRHGRRAPTLPRLEGEAPPRPRRRWHRTSSRVRPGDCFDPPRRCSAPPDDASRRRVPRATKVQPRRRASAESHPVVARRTRMRFRKSPPAS